MEGGIDSEPFICPKCGSRNLESRYHCYLSSEGLDSGWEIICKDCGELIDED